MPGDRHVQRGTPPKFAHLLAGLDRIEPLDETGTAIPSEPTELTVMSGHSAAGPQYNTPLADVSTTEVFDIDLFEQNIRTALDGETVGHAYSIGKSGNLYRQDGASAWPGPRPMERCRSRRRRT